MSQRVTLNPCILYHDQIIKAHQEGETNEAIAKQIGATVKEVRNYRWSSGVWGAKQFTHCKNYRKQIDDLYKQGESIENIALKTCFQIKVVRRYLWVTNAWSDTSVDQTDMRHQCSFYHKQILELYKAGHSFSHIGKRLGFDVNTIKRYLQKTGAMPKITGGQLRKSVGSNFGENKVTPIICEWPPRRS